MPPSDLERKERELERRIAEKEREIGEDVEAIRSTARSVARTASNTATGLGVGAAVLAGAFVTWKIFQAVRHARFPRIDLRRFANFGRIRLFRPRHLRRRIRRSARFAGRPGVTSLFGSPARPRILAGHGPSYRSFLRPPQPRRRRFVDIGKPRRFVTFGKFVRIGGLGRFARPQPLFRGGSRGTV